MKPWVISSVLKPIKLKFLLQKIPQDPKCFWHHRYKHYRNTLNGLISKSKRKHLRKYFQDNQQNFKRMWFKIDEVLQNKKRLDETLHIFDNLMTISDTTKIAYEFNSCFTIVAQELLKKTRKNKQQVSGLPEKSQ